MHDVQKIFFLTPVEYAILLAGKGVKEHYTLQADSEEISEEQICLGMAHLYQTGFIDSDSEQFFILEQLDEILTIIAEAETIFCARFGRHEKRDFCCFTLGDKVALVRLSRKDENTYEVSQSSKEELYSIFVQNLTTTQVYEPVLEEELCYRELCESRESISREMIGKFHNLLFALERISPKNGAINKRILVRLEENGIAGEEVKNARGQRISSKEGICGVIKEIVENGGN